MDDLILGKARMSPMNGQIGSRFVLYLLIASLPIAYATSDSPIRFNVTIKVPENASIASDVPHVRTRLSTHRLLRASLLSLQKSVHVRYALSNHEHQWHIGKVSDPPTRACWTACHFMEIIIHR